MRHAYKIESGGGGGNYIIMGKLHGEEQKAMQLNFSVENSDVRGQRERAVLNRLVVRSPSKPR
jgi:transcriptional regulator CtsR